MTSTTSPPAMPPTPPAPPTPGRGFHVLTKPIGPICNLGCKYCFYLEKEHLYQDERRWAMSDEVLEEYIRQYIGQQDVPEIDFAWQGGEPTLLGVKFFEKVVAFQARHARGKVVRNALQTNGTLLDDDWCSFLTKHRFLVGLSVDGPRELHDTYRVDKKNGPTFDAVMRGLAFLKKHGTEFNTLTVVNRANAARPLEVYRFLKEIGSGFLQFIPLVERQAPVRLKVLGFDFAEPPSASPAPSSAGASAAPDDSPVTPWSVGSEQYGNFLKTIFDEWVREDVGRTFVQLFDVALGNWAGMGSTLCVFAEKCGTALAIEHNGDLYSCDHYVYPQYRLGNILNRELGELVWSEAQRAFGEEKSSTLPAYCRGCEVRFACNGECPKHRFIRTPDGEPGLNYLCAGYKAFFRHIDPYMKTMVELLRRGRAPAEIMALLRANRGALPAMRAASVGRPVGRNDPCPCGSGKKFKKCCGAA